MSLAEVKEKIKSLALLLTKKDVYVAIIIVLVGLASFFLGALWQKDQNREDVTIKSADTAVFEAENGNEEGSTTDAYVGSYTSKIYRLATCPGVNAIREDNKVWFSTKADAEAAGYVAAKNCNM